MVILTGDFKLKRTNIILHCRPTERPIVQTFKDFLTYWAFFKQNELDLTTAFWKLIVLLFNFFPVLNLFHCLRFLWFWLSDSGVQLKQPVSFTDKLTIEDKPKEKKLLENTNDRFGATAMV